MMLVGHIKILQFIRLMVGSKNEPTLLLSNKWEA